MDIYVENHGTLILVRPATPVAKSWIEENVSDEATFWAGALVVEPRYVHDLLRGMKADGLEINARVEGTP